MRLSYLHCINEGGCGGITVRRGNTCVKCGSRWACRIQRDGCRPDERVGLGLAVFFTWLMAVTPRPIMSVREAVGS